ncbi:decapping 5-like protein [Gastrolobium bilobum]|uniref:decapping 5-like protein n=1 Tax=Gastrolobium bilobum TaxID=150636 RepID=UPI002AB05A93|nr:decapping 5-like protein [Gastrolobium bilobum]
MASESGMIGPSTPSSNSVESYIGSFISLISKCEIRYEGVLYFLNFQDSTIGLQNVSSYGTEGRRKDGPQVPPSDKVYEYILFRGNDIKNLQIKPSSTFAKEPEQIFSDPAIIQIRLLCPVKPFLLGKTPMPYSASMTFDGSNMPSFSLPLQDLSSIEGQISGKICPDPRPLYAGHSDVHPASSFVDSTSVPLPTPPSFSTLDQFVHRGEQLFSLTPNLTPNRKDVGSLTPASCGSSVLMPSPASRAPLLPLPTSVHKPQCSASQFTEEFDFEAMNEKFKKDEVWGSLGKATTKIVGAEDNASPLSLGDNECHGMIPNPKSAYEKDDFFDTISCNSMTRGVRNGRNRLSERMRLDTETFGIFQQRPNVGYGGYGAGRGENFRGSYNWGRGYGYGRRGRGPNFPF